MRTVVWPTSNFGCKVCSSTSETQDPYHGQQRICFLNQNPPHFPYVSHDYPTVMVEYSRPRGLENTRIKCIRLMIGGARILQGQVVYRYVFSGQACYCLTELRS